MLSFKIKVVGVARQSPNLNYKLTTPLPTHHYF